MANLYESGDKVFLFGFSRGAFTARSVTGIIQKCGLPDFRNSTINDASKRKFAYDAFNQYRGGTDLILPKDLTFHIKPKIEFLGVFDTVGSLGVPDELDWLSSCLSWVPGLGRCRLRFENTELSEVVIHARHALAIDERRRAFTPTVWPNQGKNQKIKELWFPGIHSDIGGGYEDTSLSDFPLKWMMKAAQSKGLSFQKNFFDQIKGVPQGELHESVTSVFQRMRLRPRAVPLFSTDKVSKAAKNRQAAPPIIQPYYWRTHDLNPTDKPHCFYVNAKSRWDPADLYVYADQTYQFTAVGAWNDKSIKTGPNGRYGTFNHFDGHIAPIVWGAQVFANLRGGQAAKGFSPLTRRQPEMPWFALAGCVANGREVNSKTQEIEQHQHFLIGDGKRLGHFTPRESGFLYCYANDV